MGEKIAQKPGGEMREFKTAARKADDQQQTLTIKLDDVELVSVRPTETLMVFIMAAQSSETRNEGSRMADMIDGVLALFDEDSRRHLKQRLLDPEDSFSFDSDDEDSVDLMGLLQGVIEEWSNLPTKLSSDSTSSSEDSGTGSTESASPEASTSLVSA